MATVTKGSTSVSYKYNDSGIRTSKTVNGVEHIYTLNGSQIVSETWGNNTLIYLYDEAGSPIGMQYRQSGMSEGLFYTFFFEKNLFGDVVAIYNEYGVKVLSYTYDAWGNVTQTWHNLMAQNLYAQYNPFRYRGYYYDTETGFYYLESRYYDPATGRFINADGHVNANGDLIGYNMYAYCSNNPVMYTDPTGEFAISMTAICVISGVLIGASIGGWLGYEYAQSNDIDEEDQWKYVVGGALLGGAVGGLAGYAAAPSIVAATGIAGVSVSTAGLSIIPASGGLIIADYVNNANTFISWATQQLEKTQTVLSKQQVKYLFYKANEYGVKIAGDLSGHENTNWPMPHIHLGDKRVHVAVAQEAIKWISEHIQ